MLAIAEKFPGHFPVNTGSYVTGKVGYKGGGRDSEGIGYWGMTEGEI